MLLIPSPLILVLLPLSLIPPQSMRKKKKQKKYVRCELCKKHKASIIATTLNNEKLKVCKYCFIDLAPYIKSYTEISHRRKYILHHDIISGRLVPCRI